MNIVDSNKWYKSHKLLKKMSIPKPGKVDTSISGCYKWSYRRLQTAHVPYTIWRFGSEAKIIFQMPWRNGRSRLTSIEAAHTRPVIHL